MSVLDSRRLVIICLSRILLFATFMTVAATIPLLIGEWGISATAAGAIVAAFTTGYAVSLFAFAWLSDHFGARQMVVVSAVASGATGVAFGLFATDWWSAMLLYGLAGLAQGGVYTPLIMVISDEVPPRQRGRAMGWLIASTSVGYAVSLATAGLGAAFGGWRTAFLLTGMLPAIGAVVLIWAVAPLPNRIHPRAPDVRVSDELLRNREARLLVTGYTAHNWELVGMWAWIPAFLAAAFAAQGADAASALLAGAYVAGFLHLFGAVAAFSMGILSDRVGDRPIMIGLACAGAMISFCLGWLLEAPAFLLVPVALVYAFVCLGDSPVLTTALSQAVRPGYLGAILAWRALLGFSAGAAAPLAFGVGFDLFSGAAPPALAWAVGFSILGLGGVGALACALARGKTPA